MKTTSRFLRPLAPDTPTKDLHFKMCIHTHTRRESPGRKPHQVKHSHLLLLLPSSPAERGGGGSPSSARRSSFSSPSSYTTTTTTKSRVYLFCGVASGRLGLTQQPSIRSCAHAGPPFHQGPVFFLPFIQRHLKKQQQQCLFLLCVSARCWQCRHTRCLMCVRTCEQEEKQLRKRRILSEDLAIQRTARHAPRVYNNYRLI